MRCSSNRTAFACSRRPVRSDTGKRLVKLGRVEPTRKWRLETAYAVAGGEDSKVYTRRRAHYTKWPLLLFGLLLVLQAHWTIGEVTPQAASYHSPAGSYEVDSLLLEWFDPTRSRRVPV